jgi:HEAT repeat protein
LSRRFPRHYDEIREAVTSVLVGFGEPAVEPLIEALADEDEDVRSYAAEALKATGDPRAMEPLAKLLEDPEQFRMETLIEALGDEDWEVRQNAAYALEGIGNEQAVEALIKAIGDNEESVSNNVLGILIGMGEPVVEPLIKAATRLIDTGAVREWQVEMLGQREVIQGWGLCQIANALGAIGDARAIELLIRIITDENVGWDCGPEEAADALGKIGDARAVEPLIKALGDENRGTAHYAAEALGKIGDVRAVEPLIKALSAMRTIKQYAQANGGTVMYTVTEDDDVRDAAKEALKKLGHEVDE